MIKKIKNFFGKKTTQTEELSVEEKIKNLYNSLKVCELRLELGSDLSPFYKNSLKENLWEIRERVFKNTGIIIPLIRVLDNKLLQENEFTIYIREQPLYTGYTVANSDCIKKDVLYNFEQLCKENLDSIISYQNVERYIELVQEKNTWLIWEVSNFFNVSEIRKIIIGLVQNNRSIKDIIFVFEQLAKYTGMKNIDKIVLNISAYLPKYEWDIPTREYPKFNIEEIFRL